MAGSPPLWQVWWAPRVEALELTNLPGLSRARGSLIHRITVQAIKMSIDRGLGLPDPRARRTGE